MSCCNMNDPKTAAKLALRLGFGLSLLLVGVAHYMNLEMFMAMTSDGLGPLTFLGTIWAYVLPALQIVGGALFAVGMYYEIAAWSAGVALGSIPVGMLLKPVLSGVALPDVMPAAINAFIWLIIYALVVKMCTCCGSSCGTSSGGGQQS
ncbi:MAG: hypothetical protein HOG89_01860 [Candidatus Peribacter sp.]|nr:hypothetical protein [Candidatus Peribacter sp.]MBT4392813.1 hypothetical protein [Candidatus Peribacter sp.]MBT4601444.1 hypothetical protein [Candidatus Peribacter sp.]MBT5148761.1 hypothetical protein [Candidatus Peribacter sp.]MBT5637643.1 hypothetical protein [Candidatus Peribacter sp.]